MALPAAATTPNAQQLAVYEQANEVDRVKLLMVLAKSPEHDQVTYLLQRYPLQGPHASNRTRFLQGLVLKENGRLTEAAKMFRAVLANDPGLTVVRSELAETLLALQQDDSAVHQLRLLAAGAPDEKTANDIRSFIDKVDSRRPYTINGYVSFAPSTNLNSGSKHTTVYSPALGISFTPDQPKSGIGIATGVNLGYSKRLGDNFMFVGAAGADLRLYRDRGFDSYGFSQSADIRYNFSKGYIGFGAVASEQLDNQTYQPSYKSYGPRVSLSFQLTGKDQLTASALHEWRDTKGVATSTIANNYDASWTHNWNSTLVTTMFGSWDHVNTGNKVSSYRNVSLGLAIYRELPMGINATLTGIVGRADFEGYNAIAGHTRADKKIATSLTLTKRDFEFRGFAPSINYSFSDNFSNINNYDTAAHAVDFRLTRDF